MAKKFTDKEALDYHQYPQPGKLAIEITKSVSTQKDLSLAYTPGVAVPCLAIEKNPDDAYKYTAKNNLVGVISNGTAVLGLGNIGAFPRHGEADQAPAMTGHEVHLLRRGERRRNNEIALVLAVFCINEDEHPPVAGILDDLVDRGDRVLELF